MKMRFLKPIMLLTTLSIAGAACNKMLDLKPENLTLAEEALNTPADVQALLNSCYDEFANLMNGSVQNYHELMGEHLSEPPSLAGSLYYSVYKRGTFSFRTADREYLDFYNCILRVNTIFGRMGSVPGIDAATADRLKGEGYFLRAWCHWELVKLWAQPYGFTADNSHPGVPIRLNADKSIELRSTVKQVYDRILLDLDSSIALIPESNGNYADRHAAIALKAKVLFFMNRFSDALDAANTVLNSGRYSFSDSLNRFASDVPQETIFKLVSTGPSDNRGSALINNYRSDNNPNPNLKPSKAFAAIAMQGHDRRSAFYEAKNPGKANEYFVCHKFDKDYFNVPLLHYTDLMLLRAECLLETGGDKTTAIDDVDRVRKRAYGTKWTPLDNLIPSLQLMDSLRLQRKLEMAFEGDWTLQQRRLGAKGLNIKIRNSPWNCPGLVLQFPQSENTKGFIFNEEGGCN
jgi:hypothetical protein